MPEPIGGVQPFAELARNGPTVVYKGYQSAHDRFVLLKAVRSDLAAEQGLAERLAEEARLAAQIRHPNVVAVLEFGHDRGTAYLITEFVEGLDLRDLLARGPLPVPLAVYLVRKIAEGLRAVHASGILHRDLKPANVLVAATGEVKVADFGLASLAPQEGGEMRGTLAYLAPEVVGGAVPTEAADLFALGAVLAEALTGRAVFARADTGATLDAVLNHDPVPALAADPRVPTALVVLAAKLLAKAPEQRLASAMHLVGKLEAVEDLHGRAGADAFAAFVRDPSAYALPLAPAVEAERAGPPATTGRTDPAPDRRAEARPEARPVMRRSRLPWVAAALAGIVLLGYGMARPFGSAPPLDEEPVVAIAPADSLRAAPTRVTVDSTRQVAERLATEQSSAASSSEMPSETPLPTEAADAARDSRVERESEPEDVAETDTPVLPESPTDSEATPSAVTAGTLRLTVEPWATVRIDGEPAGTTPIGALRLAAGTHTVTFENPDFPAHTVPVVVRSGEEARLAVSLWDLVGRLTLAVRPWARVSVNGVYWDTVPPQERPLILPPGTHRLRFEHPTLGTHEEVLPVAAGEVRTVGVNLTEPPP